MAHFNFENEVSKLIRMDAPITKGPQMRWQRKLSESINSSRNESICNNSVLQSSQCCKTPKSKGLSTRTPGKTPGSTTKTPGKTKQTPGKGSKTPTTMGDRFIPNRSTTQFELGHYHVTSQSNGNDSDEEMMSPSKKEFQSAMSENLNGDLMNSKIISYKNKAPSAPEGYQNSLKVLYSQAHNPTSCKKSIRHIPQVPERILDAPQILDDYYLNLVDWSVNGHMAVCLGGYVYVWNSANGEIQQLMEMEGPEDYVSSVSWISEGNYLAIGTSTADVQVWDVEHNKMLRNMRGHAARVGSLCWNNYILSSGSRSGNIHHHDVRVANHQVGTLSGHTQEVCGLRWSPDGRFLASGGNDNLLNIWPSEGSQYLTADTPVYTFTQHQAAVKALAWCPWHPSLLASGGGTADRHIRFWNCNTGVCVNSIDTKSQVCSILWSKHYKELVSSHGFAQNQLILWKYPSMTKVAELTGHTARVLHMAMSPDGSTVVSAAADETLRLWKCFAVDPIKKKTPASMLSAAPKTMMRSGIR